MSGASADSVGSSSLPNHGRLRLDHPRCCGGTHSLALSFKAASYSGVFTLAPILTGVGRAAHGAIVAEATRLVEAGKVRPTFNRVQIPAVQRDWHDRAHAAFLRRALWVLPKPSGRVAGNPTECARFSRCSRKSSHMPLTTTHRSWRTYSARAGDHRMPGPSRRIPTRCRTSPSAVPLAMAWTSPAVLPKERYGNSSGCASTDRACGGHRLAPSTSSNFGASSSTACGTTSCCIWRNARTPSDYTQSDPRVWGAPTMHGARRPREHDHANHAGLQGSAPSSIRLRASGRSLGR